MYPSSGRSRGGYDSGRGSSYRGRHPSSSYQHYGGRYGGEYPPRPPPERDQYEYKSRGPPSESYYKRGGGDWRGGEGGSRDSRYREEYSYRGSSYPPRGRSSYHPMTNHYRGQPYHRGYGYRGTRGMRGRGRYEPRGYGRGRGRGDSGYYNPGYSSQQPPPHFDRPRFQYRREDDLKEKRVYEEERSPRNYYESDYKRVRRASPEIRIERRRSSTPVDDRFDWLDDGIWIDERRRNWPTDGNIVRKTRYQSQENDDNEVQIKRWTEQLLAVLKVQKENGIAQQAGTIELVQNRHRIGEFLDNMNRYGASNWSQKEKEMLLQSIRFLCINNFFRDIGTTPIDYNITIPCADEDYDHDKVHYEAEEFDYQARMDEHLYQSRIDEREFQRT